MDYTFWSNWYISEKVLLINAVRIDLHNHKAMSRADDWSPCTNDTIFQVWQAIEKVLLEDSLCHPGSGGGEDGPQFTQLAPVLQLEIPDQQQQQQYMQATTGTGETECKVARISSTGIGRNLPILFIVSNTKVFNFF